MVVTNVAGCGGNTSNGGENTAAVEENTAAAEETVDSVTAAEEKMESTDAAGDKGEQGGATELAEAAEDERLHQGTARRAQAQVHAVDQGEELERDCCHDPGQQGRDREPRQERQLLNETERISRS